MYPSSFNCLRTSLGSMEIDIVQDSKTISNVCKQKLTFNCQTLPVACIRDVSKTKKYSPAKMSQLTSVVTKFIGEYNQQTPKKLKLIDAYLFYILLTGVFQFVYCCLVGTFPFNSFLSGFISTISCFILGGMYILLVTHCIS